MGEMTAAGLNLPVKGAEAPKILLEKLSLV
jgi:hypothetical protein